MTRRNFDVSMTTTLSEVKCHSICQNQSLTNLIKAATTKRRFKDLTVLWMSAMLQWSDLRSEERQVLRFDLHALSGPIRLFVTDSSEECGISHMFSEICL